MRATKRADLGFFACLLINMLLNLEGTIPAWILLACHYIFQIPLWPFWVALGIWVLGLILWMYFIGWAAACGNEPTKNRPNKNPYSVGAKNGEERN